MTPSTEVWPDDIFRALMDLDVIQVGYVPDAGHTKLIQTCIADNRVRAVPLTSEEEGIGLLAGAWLGGQRGAMLMQGSGIGNIVNMLCMARTCRLPMLMIATMRGQWGEMNPWQVPMGQTAEETLRLQDVTVYSVDRPEDVGEAVTAAGRIAFNGPAMAAVLISQRIIGTKEFKD